MGRLSKAEGEQLAQVSNPDPFAAPVWRSPVYRTPEFVIWIVQLLRLLWHVAWFVIRHPGLDVTAGALLLLWINTGWPGLAVLAGAVLVALVALRLAWPYWFARLVTRPVRDRWRWWCYRRRWQAVLTITRLAPLYQGRVLLPVLGRVNSSRFTDRVAVGLVSGQSPKDFADRAEGLAHGFRVRQCRVRAGRPGTITLELVRRDALAEPIPALPISPDVNLRALPVGRCEDGSPFTLRLHGTHLLIAGATGAGKGLDVLVLPDAHVGGGDAAARLDGGGFHHDERGAADGAAAEVDQMPVVGEAVVGGILAHGRYGNAVAEGHVAQCEGREQVDIIGTHRTQYGSKMAS